MTRRWIVGAAVVVLSVGLAWGMRWWIRPRPSLVEAAALAGAGRLSEALERVDQVLADHPDDAGAHLLAAQILLELPSGSVDAALAHLQRIQTDDRGLAAMALLTRGKAERRLGLLDEAEASWLAAIRAEEQVAEAGWCLLELYYLQSRNDEARTLALRLHEVEPDPRDRVLLLVELLRQDAQPPAPGSIAAWFARIVEQHPEGLRAPIAMGLALVRAGEADRGLDLLRRTAERHPERIEAWDAWLTGLDDAGRVEELAEVLESVPPVLRQSPRLDRHRARVAQESGDWPEAVRWLRKAVAEAPNDLRLLYRLGRAARLAGDPDAARIEAEHAARQSAKEAVRPLYEEVSAIPDLGLRRRPDLYRKLADLRERMGLRDEARAWHRLILRGSPGDRESLAALRRLESDRPPP